MEQENTTLSERIRDTRTSMGLTQTQLAERIGISQRQIAKYEAGIQLPRTIILDRLSAVLGVSPEYLLSGTRQEANGRLPLLTRYELMKFGESFIPPSEYAEIILPNRPQAFAYRYIGDTLEPYYSDGEILIIDPSHQTSFVDIGKKNLYLIKDENLISIRHITIGTNITLWVPNRNYPPIVLPNNDVTQLKVIGKVIGSIS